MKRHVPGGPCGFVLLDKPLGPSSHQALSGFKRRFGTGRIGHAGTLDPAASGLLVCAVGKATRLLNEVEAREKEYLFALRLGLETDSLDLQGAVLRTALVPDPASIDWDALLPRFVGNLSQVPPAVSALRVDGVRAYELVRQGKTVELPSRPVTIHSLEMLPESHEGDPMFRLRCSKGTYVRSLARDLGEALGSPACVSLLRRTAIGPWRVPDQPLLPDENADPPLLPVAAFLSGWPRFQIGESDRQALRTGKSLTCPLPDTDQALALDGDEALAAGRVEAGCFRPSLLLIDAQ